MNIREDSTIRAPSGKDDICAKFTIDTVNEPFVLHDIAQVGQEYTFSFWCYSETDGEITVGGLYMTTSSSWTRYVVTFIADSVDVPIYFNIAGTYYLYNTQLEIGCKDTDFALNPADLEEDVENLAVIVSNHTTQFTVMDGKIAGLIEENTTIRGEYDTLVDRTADLELTVSDFTVELESTKTIISDNYISLQEYTNTQIAAMESEISLSVANTYSTKAELETVDGKVTTLEEWQVEASQQITKEGIIATVGNYYAYQTDLEGVEDRVEAAESQIIQHADEIALRVEKDGIINAINLSTEEVKIEASRITLAGATIADSFTATNLHITGDSVFDGTLRATKGTIAGWDISSTSISSTNTSGNYVHLGNASNANQDVLVVRTGAGTTASPYSWPVVIRATGEAIFSNAKITGNITAKSLTAYDNVKVYDSASGKTHTALSAFYTSETSGVMLGNGSSEVRCATFFWSYGNILSNGSITASSNFKVGSTSYNDGWIELYGGTPFIDFHTGSSADDFVSRIIDCGDSSAGHLRLISDRVTITGNGYAVTIGEGFTSGNTTFMPVKSQNSQPTAADGVVYNGASGSRWLTMYAKNGVNTTSDERDKNIIGEIDQRYLDAFMDFKAVLYRWKDDDLGKIHMGLVAQSTEQTLLEHGISMDEFAALEHDYWDAPNEEGRIDRYGLNYSELLTVMVPVVQMQESAIADHEYRLDIVENHQESMDDQLSAAFERISELESQLSEAKNEIEQLKQQASVA